MRTVAVCLALLVIAVAAGCGGGDPPAATEGAGAAGGAGCGRVTVPGHEAIGIRASGVECSIAREVAAAAEGRGRQPYMAAGFSCEPADAGTATRATRASATRGA